MVSEDAELEGTQAMQELDQAVGAAASMTRVAEVALRTGGKLLPGVDLARMAPEAGRHALEASLEETPLAEDDPDALGFPGNSAQDEQEQAE
jgi:hypothetical protein